MPNEDVRCAVCLRPVFMNEKAKQNLRENPEHHEHVRCADCARMLESPLRVA